MLTIGASFVGAAAVRRRRRRCRQPTAGLGRDAQARERSPPSRAVPCAPPGPRARRRAGVSAVSAGTSNRVKISDFGFGPEGQLAQPGDQQAFERRSPRGRSPA
ncbi:MAG: hypothetical protein MZV70_68135 [Desulfobacterales bacterium]|nr:hypothetical protein [Desulfobacterales bacterium]